MTPVELSRTVRRAVRRAVDSGELSVAVPERVVVTPPRPGGCGDYASNVALQLARPAGQPALRVAQVLRGHLLQDEAIDDISVTGPGFINITLRRHGSGTRAGVLVDRVLRGGVAYGSVQAQTDGSPFQSCVVHLRPVCEVRAVVVADVVARLLRAQGAAVSTSCDGEAPAAWGDVLGARSDCRRTPPVESYVTVRPVPAPADPLPLGRDAGRWALLLPAGHDRPRVSADPHLVQRESNPLFRVRYAHARTRALSRNAADLGFQAEPGAVGGAEGEAGAETLLGLLADHPRILARAAELRAPDVLARHLVTVADAVLPFLAGVLPVGEEKPSAAHRARLALAEAAGTVLAGGLYLLGIDAPDHL
ncbi:ArgS-related anticodon-binding protein NrtL [Streptomyces naganishii]|uniref:arginine--tRNA ligase n=1 Tax=Streptomyces naganishii JCM 4654 TaxID=1306179 RepID=A0A918Y3N9_9ACTN|nr:DALR anticodon-binding domain-containing protein [Streptomyces naganishii]GHD90082.1 hypothetical protein GCM10010508_33380 [Streptomyces naganishii JCM 4654]